MGTELDAATAWEAGADGGAAGQLVSVCADQKSHEKLCWEAAQGGLDLAGQELQAMSVLPLRLDADAVVLAEGWSWILRWLIQVSHAVCLPSHAEHAEVPEKLRPHETWWLCHAEHAEIQAYSKKISLVVCWLCHAGHAATQRKPRRVSHEVWALCHAVHAEEQQQLLSQVMLSQRRAADCVVESCVIQQAGAWEHQRQADLWREAGFWREAAVCVGWVQRRMKLLQQPAPLPESNQCALHGLHLNGQSVALQLGPTRCPQQAQPQLGSADPPQTGLWGVCLPGGGMTCWAGQAYGDRCLRGTRAGSWATTLCCQTPFWG